MFASTALVFVPLLALAAMTLLILLAFAAHYFLTMVECRAQGQAEIQWPHEQFTDWLFKPLRLVWMIGPYLFASVLLAGSIGWAADSRYAAAAVTIMLLAALAPIGLLSSFLAGNPWACFHPQAIVLPFTKPYATFGFFCIGLSSAALGLGGAYFAMFSERLGWLGAVVGGIVAALGWFTYACALGNWLYTLTYVPPPRRKRRKKRREPASGPGAPPPLAVDEPEPTGRRPPPAWDPEFDDTPYEAHAAEVVTKEVHADIAKPKDSEVKLLERTPPPPPPHSPLSAEAFAPFGQTETLRNVLLLAVMFALQSGLVRMLVELNPAK